MDLDGWDLLSDEGFLDLQEDGRERNFSSKFAPNITTTVIDMDYFQKFSQPNKKLNSRVIPVPIQFDYAQEKTEEYPEKIESLKPDDHQIKDDHDHQETVSQVFFKKLKENEFADMKLDTPKSLNRGILPQIDVGSYQFEEEERKSVNFEKNPDEKIKENIEILSENDENEGLNVWKWAMNGIGALFSFGFAAVTVSLIVLGNRNKATSNNSKNQELHFQFYNHDKRMKQAVHPETRFNEVIAVMRGAPVTRARITIGGFYEGL